MKASSAKQKGKILEEWVTNRLIQSGLDLRAYPQKGSGSGIRKGDIWNSLDIHFECKNQKNFGGKEWFKQMKDENVSHLKEVLVWHPPQVSLDESKVIIDWDYFEELLVGNKGTKSVIENPNLKWPLQNLSDAIKKVLKVLPE